MTKVENSVIAITCSKAQRERIVDFLAHFEDEDRDEEFWARRLRFWWEDNPFFSDKHPRGWLLFADSQIVGFFGIIVTDYLNKNKRFKALNASTWRVAAQYRNLSMSLFLRFYSLKNKYLLFNTSPTDNVAEVLETFKFQKMTRIYEYVFPLCRKSLVNPVKMFHHLKGIPQRRKLPRGNCRLMTKKDTFIVPDMTQIMSEHYLVKDTGMTYLKWMCFNNEQLENKVIGFFADEKKVSSFLILKKHKKKIKVLDYFTLDSSGIEVLSMINYACHTPEVLPDSTACSLIFRDFIEQGMIRHRALSRFQRKEELVRHYYSRPQPLNEVPIRRTIAQGDYGF